MGIAGNALDLIRTVWSREQALPTSGGYLRYSGDGKQVLGFGDVLLGPTTGSEYAIICRTMSALM